MTNVRVFEGLIQRQYEYHLYAMLRKPGFSELFGQNAQANRTLNTSSSITYCYKIYLLMPFSNNPPRELFLFDEPFD